MQKLLHMVLAIALIAMPGEALAGWSTVIRTGAKIFSQTAQTGKRLVDPFGSGSRYGARLQRSPFPSWRGFASGLDDVKTARERIAIQKTKTDIVTTGLTDFRVSAELTAQFADEAAPHLFRLMRDAKKQSARLNISHAEAVQKVAAAEAKKVSPAFTFNVTSGKWTFNRKVRYGNLEIEAGSINLYLFAGLSLGATACTTTDECVEAGKRILQNTFEESDWAKGIDRMTRELNQVDLERNYGP